MVYGLLNLLHVSLFQDAPLTARSKERTGCLKLVFIPTLLIENTNTQTLIALTRKQAPKRSSMRNCVVFVFMMQELQDRNENKKESIQRNNLSVKNHVSIYFLAP